MKGETNMKFSSKKFKEIRKKSGLSQLELAIRASEIDGCAITDKIISAWENNTSIQPRQYNLEAVAKVLGVNVYDFYSDVSDAEINTIISNAIERLANKQKKHYTNKGTNFNLLKYFCEINNLSYSLEPIHNSTKEQYSKKPNIQGTTVILDYDNGLVDNNYSEGIILYGKSNQKKLIIPLDEWIHLQEIFNDFAHFQLYKLRKEGN